MFARGMQLTIQELVVNNGCGQPLQRERPVATCTARAARAPPHILPVPRHRKAPTYSQQMSSSVAAASTMQADRGALQCSPMYHGGMLGLISVKPHSSTTCTSDEEVMTTYMMPLLSLCMTHITIGAG